MVEAKVVYGLNYAEAVRGAVGQLFEYRHFLRPDSLLVALFDQPIGQAFTSYLNSLEVSVVWTEEANWATSSQVPQINNLTSSS